MAGGWKGKVKRLFPEIKLQANGDGSYDLLLYYTKQDMELAAEPGFAENERHKRTLRETVLEYGRKAKIKSVKVLVGGTVVAAMAFSMFTTALGASDRYVMGYLYAGTDSQHMAYVEETGDVLDVVSPSYFDIEADGSLRLNYLSEELIAQMHAKGIRVVPFLSNHWNREAGIRALADVEGLSDAIAGYVDAYDLDGVNVDIENVTEAQKDSYTELVRLLREKIPAHKEVSVAVAANPSGWQTGWHGSYDYAALAEYADHLMIMAYDEHHEGGAAGPVAGIDSVCPALRRSGKNCSRRSLLWPCVEPVRQPHRGKRNQYQDHTGYPGILSVCGFL